jgi:hypothetical protein
MSSRKTTARPILDLRLTCPSETERRRQALGAEAFADFDGELSAPRVLSGRLATAPADQVRPRFPRVACPARRLARTAPRALAKEESQCRRSD